MKVFDSEAQTFSFRYGYVQRCAISRHVALIWYLHRNKCRFEYHQPLFNQARTAAAGESGVNCAYQLSLINWWLRIVRNQPPFISLVGKWMKRRRIKESSSSAALYFDNVGEAAASIIAGCATSWRRILCRLMPLLSLNDIERASSPIE